MTPIRCGADAWAHQDVRPGDTVAWPTNLGWMMGPWLLYAALLNGACIALYQVGHPPVHNVVTLAKRSVCPHELQKSAPMHLLASAQHLV